MLISRYEDPFISALIYRSCPIMSFIIVSGIGIWVDQLALLGSDPPPLTDNFSKFTMKSYFPYCLFLFGRVNFSLYIVYDPM